jgi:cytochrome P450
MTDAATTGTDAGSTAGRDLAGCPVKHYDFAQSAEVGTYLRLADELREEGPVFFNSFAQGYWVFTRHDAVREIYRQADLFSSESFTPHEPNPVYRFVPTQIDPPEHVKYRQILNPWFSPNAVEALVPEARAICARLLDELADRGECDFINDFALRYPTEVFLTSIGVPTDRCDDFVGWVEGFFRGFSGNPEHLDGMVAALGSIRTYWEGVLEERRHAAVPRGRDLATHLLGSTIDGRPLTDTEMLDMLVVLVLAGLDTTQASLGFLFRHLAQHPEHRRQVVDDPTLVPTLVEESLRLYTIIFADGRKVTRDEEFFGVQLRAGDMVCGLVAGANRDPRVYDRADEFVVDRTGTHHLGFAAGPHRCLGAHLARREMQIVVEEWLARIPDFSLAESQPPIERGGGAMLALQHLYLQWNVST